jgi:hypothetical protein
MPFDIARSGYATVPGGNKLNIRPPALPPNLKNV